MTADDNGTAVSAVTGPNDDGNPETLKIKLLLAENEDKLGTGFGNAVSVKRLLGPISVKLYPAGPFRDTANISNAPPGAPVPFVMLTTPRFPVVCRKLPLTANWKFWTLYVPILGAGLLSVGLTVKEPDTIAGGADPEISPEKLYVIGAAIAGTTNTPLDNNNPPVIIRLCKALTKAFFIDASLLSFVLIPDCIFCNRPEYK